VKTLRETMDKLKDKLGSAAIVLAAVAEGKVTLIAGVTSDLTGKVKAGELVNHVAQQVAARAAAGRTWRRRRTIRRRCRGRSRRSRAGSRSGFEFSPIHYNCASW